MFQSILEKLRSVLGKGRAVFYPVDDSDKWVKLVGESASLVDEDQVPDSVRDKEPDEGSRGRQLDRCNRTDRARYWSQQVRHHGYNSRSSQSLLKRATDNHYILSDLLDDPGLVGAESEVEVVAKVAEVNPGWAKISSMPEAYSIDIDPASGEVGRIGGERGSPTGDVSPGNEGSPAEGDTSGRLGHGKVSVDTESGTVRGLGGDVGGGDL